MELNINECYSPQRWVSIISESVKRPSKEIVEQHLIGAILEKRFIGIPVPNHSAHAGDFQTGREGDFTISKSVYHVTAIPSRSMIQKCVENIKTGLSPILLIPNEQLNRAKFLAQEEEVDKELTIIPIEDFFAFNIIELAAEESKDFYSVLKEIVQIYNKRLSEVETDSSLQIQIR